MQLEAMWSHAWFIGRKNDFKFSIFEFRKMIKAAGN